MQSDYDGAWKDLLHGHLREVLACYFPAVAVAIDWSAPVRFLEQELRQLPITEDSPGNRVDILVEVATFEAGPQTLQFREKIVEFDQMNTTAYLTDLEELAMEKGCTLTRQQAVIEALEIRFDRVPEGLREEIGAVTDSARLHALHRAAIRCPDIETFAREL
jgi:hypothetical protein